MLSSVSRSESRPSRAAARAAGLLVAGAAAGFVLAAVGPAAAHGPTPQKVDQAIELAVPCELVWSTLRDFGSIGKWHPEVTAIEATGASEPGVTRTLTLKNGESITERIDDVDGAAQSLSYRLSKENLKALPVSFYTAKIATTRSEDGQGCRVDWQGRFYRGDTGNFPPDDLNDAAAVAAMTSFFETGLAGLKAALE